MLNINREIEYKSLASPAELAKIAADHPEARSIRQINHYYQSANGAGFFRIREKEGSWLFTNKEKAALGRIEREKYLSGPEISDPEILVYLASLGLYPPFRKAAQLITDRTEIILPEEAHLCLDHNYYSNKEDTEIEYEFSGPLASLPRFIECLAAYGIAYREVPVSKMKRALEAALREAP